MQNPLISIIIPIYNVEKYLEKCIDSIVNQTYTNLEIILVDDGSPDKCPQICDKWAKKDSRINIIHKKNGGAADSRNVGLDASHGEYISFVDGDDYLNNDYIETLYNCVAMDGSQIVTSHFNGVNKNGSSKKSRYKFDKDIIDGKMALKYLYENNNSAYVSVCNKLFHKSVFKKLRFSKGSLCSDWAIIYKIYDTIDKISCINYYGYNYVIRKNSTLRTKTNKRYYYCVQADYEQIEYFNSNNISEFNSNLLIFLYSDFKKCSKFYFSNEDSRTFLKKAFTLFRRGIKIILGKKYIFSKEFISSLIYFWFPLCVSKIYKIKHR